MDRFWFFTWRTFGTWLPGSPGFVGNYVTPTGERRSDNVPGELTADPMPALEAYARDLLSTPPVYLTAVQANKVVEQLHETARYRGRVIDAVAVMPDHIHLVFGTPGDPDPAELMEDWKAYASRALNKLIGWSPPTPRPLWWVRGGSKRIVRTDARRASAIRYVRYQERPLVVWLSDAAESLLAQYTEEPAWTDDPDELRP
jgi:REP element-mobilizing transposase RayT